MRRGAVIGTIAVLIAAAGCGGVSVDVEAETAAIRAAWDDLSAAFHEEDWPRYAEFFVQEPYFQLMHPGLREWITGADAFADVYRNRIASGDEWEFTTNRFDAQVSPQGDIAWTAIEVVLRQGDQSQTSWQLAVWQKVDGRWRVAAALASSVRSG